MPDTVTSVTFFFFFFFLHAHTTSDLRTFRQTCVHVRKECSPEISVHCASCRPPEEYAGQFQEGMGHIHEFRVTRLPVVTRDAMQLDGHPGSSLSDELPSCKVELVFPSDFHLWIVTFTFTRLWIVSE